MKTFSYPHSSEKKHQTDPLLFTYDMKNKINIDKEENPHDNKDTNDGFKTDKKDLNENMIFDGQGTKEIKNVLNEEDKEGDNEEGEEYDIQFVEKKKDENYKEFKDYNDGQEEDVDEYYYFSELVPPQNFSLNLRLAKKKYQELQKEINNLKKDIKKYNPNYPIRDYNYYK